MLLRDVRSYRRSVARWDQRLFPRLFLAGMRRRITRSVTSLARRDPQRILYGKSQACSHTGNAAVVTVAEESRMVESTPRPSDGDQQRTTYRFVIGLVMALVMVGAALRIWQYTANASLWLDEITLAKGILDLWHLLISRLPYDQLAPKGFLLLEKVAVLTLGTNDYALRLFPLVFSLIALAAFVRLAIRMLDGIGSVAATLLFATAVPLVAFGSVVKQYSADVCIAVLLWWVAYEVASRPI